MTALIRAEDGVRALAECVTLEEVRAIRDMAEQARQYARAKNLGMDAQNHGTELRLWADRRMGEMLIEAKETGEITRGGDRKSRLVEPTLILRDIGLTKFQSHVCQQMAAIPESSFTERIEGIKTRQDRLTTTGVLEVPHVAHNSGENEWYTPREYIEAARAVMGCIDVDPASSAKANEIVQAATYYTLATNGLLHDWHGRVWLNPPYAGALIGQFVTALSRQVKRGNTIEAIVLVNNATETQWFRELINIASAVAFPTGRIRFYGPQGEQGAPLQGQAILYIGERAHTFIERYKGFGWALQV